ncbi:hypothetical protein A8B75_17675 [Sphingomonadales bacterium EhC05]|nr:hypothetical protein A8B75_17675 [Sphingomonadales bacterium EhC05]
MKNLVLKKLWILSKAEKTALEQTFSPGTNLLVGENDVGKSTVVKSIYHCFGADTPQINNSRWKKANAIYCVKFEVDGKQFHILRDEKYFGVFDGNKQLISRHAGITPKGGIAEFVNDILGFRIELERQADGKLGKAGPAFYLLPFYIDQDEGWNASWTSFTGLRQFSNYRRLMIDYHLGVRPQSYYDAKKREIELEQEKSAIEADRRSLQAARNSVEKRKAYAKVDLDPVAFQAELEKVVDEYNKIYGEQQDKLQRLKDLRNQRNVIDQEIEVLKHAIAELEADFRFAERPETPDLVGCPTCGTEFENSFVERFGILDDVDQCHALIDQWLKRRRDTSKQLSDAQTEYDLVAVKLREVEKTLERKKEGVTLSELITSEGMKEVIQSLNLEIEEFLEREQSFSEKLSENARALKLDTKHKKEVLNWYKARMKEYLNSLNVSVLSEDDYKSLEKTIKLNALGSDLPRALLAQYFAFLSTMTKFNDFVLCPMVIDSPFQQEQDATNKQAIIDFISEKKLDGQQLVLATVTEPDFSDAPDIEGAELMGFISKHSVLDAAQFSHVIEEIGDMHSETLAALI